MKRYQIGMATLFVGAIIVIGFRCHNSRPLVVERITISPNHHIFDPVEMRQLSLRRQIAVPGTLIRSYERMREEDGFPTETVAMLYAAYVTEDGDTLLYVTEVRLDRADCSDVRRDELTKVIGRISDCTYEAFYVE